MIRDMSTGRTNLRSKGQRSRSVKTKT